MRLGILACDILKNEIEHITRDDPDIVVREYLEFALHEDPERMRRVIIEHADAMSGEVDAILLGYATCSSLEGITDVLKVPAVMLPGADCIDALLGPAEYNAEKKVCTGTWFSSPGWALEGINGLIKELHLDSMEGYDPSFFLDIIFASYERVLFIDTGVGDGESYRRMSEDFAEELGLRHDCRSCGLGRIQDAYNRAKGLAARAGCRDVLGAPCDLRRIACEARLEVHTPYL